MSTGYACSFVEVKPGQWYMCLANWRTQSSMSDESTIVGPFATKDVAVQYLNDHESNPGGYTTYLHEDAKRYLGASTLADIVRYAKLPPRPITGRGPVLSFRNPYGSFGHRRGGKKRHAEVGKLAADVDKLLK